MEEGLVEMRGILMEELDSGIPAATDAGRPTAAGSTGQVSYQQMLDRSKAAKMG